ncbi:MAG: alpha/beta hydrolase [Treponema sp.]|jgi:acetyl esterase/lipase|nr:alpha/beta hydrolase [Treponema sp.]
MKKCNIGLFKKAPPQDMHCAAYTDMRYGSHTRNTLDISIPQAASVGGVYNVILFIHGGIWMYGDKKNRPTFLDTFRDRLIVASMNHRYIDEHTHFPDLVDDVSAAVAYIREFCSQHNAGAKKLIIMGHSSGGHLSMLYAYQHHKTAPIPVAFCVSMAGPTDLSDLAYIYSFKKLGWIKLFYQTAEKATGYHPAEGDITEEGYSENALRLMSAISPLAFVAGDTPPTIIVHDVVDKIVPYANSAALHSVFDVYGVDHCFIALYSGIGHYLGAKTVKGGAGRYDKTVEARVVKAMNEYIAKYCDSVATALRAGALDSRAGAT